MTILITMTKRQEENGIVNINNTIDSTTTFITTIITIYNMVKKAIQDDDNTTITCNGITIRQSRCHITKYYLIHARFEKIQRWFFRGTDTNVTFTFTRKTSCCQVLEISLTFYIEQFGILIKSTVFVKMTNWIVYVHQ